MDRGDFFYALPPRLIAQRPAERRDASRLLVLNKDTGAVSHRCFSDIVEYLCPGDCLVLNDTKVIPARLRGRRGNAGVELLLLRRLAEGRWEALCKPGRRCRAGDTLSFGDGALRARVERVSDDRLRVVAFEHEGEWDDVLRRYGETPLPPYIKERAEEGRYQTVYAARDGSVAAPTAGLHFTEGLLERIERAGVRIARVTLHVGLGTFRPVTAADVREHRMHGEYCEITPSAADTINRARESGGRAVAVGTTSCRALESRADGDGRVIPGSGVTDIFILPGYAFRATDALVTNFHLPESTLIMLASAFCGRERLLAAYQTAIERGYMFCSFGDAMLIS
jgi:S-adenosylmethionine:tRNA ribosyltransferase-isomerase